MIAPIRQEVFLSYEAAEAHKLREAELRVILDLANGYKQSAIAYRLGYSEPGIQTLLRRLRHRFGADSNHQLVAILAVRGVLL